MKKTIAFLILSVLLSASCMKKRTCTCYRADGSPDGKASKSTTSKSEIRAFEDGCRSDDEKRQALYGGQGGCDLE